MSGNEELIRDIGILLHKKIVLYGAGETGCRAFLQIRAAGLDIEAFTDSDSGKWGRRILNKRVLPLEELLGLMKNGADVAIIIASVHEYDIRDALDRLPIDRGRVFSFPAFVFALYFKENIEKLKTLPNSSDLEMKLKLSSIFKYDVHDHKELGPIPNVFQKLLFHDNPVLIYQPGKVGSSTILKSLEEEGNGVNAIHTHYIEFALRYYHENKILGYEECQYIKNAILTKENLKIITAVREPVSRDISNFFQRFVVYFYRYDAGEMLMEHDGDVEEAFIDYLRKYTSTDASIHLENSFLNYMRNRVRYGYLFDWFDLELNPTLQIDVYEHPFDQKDGYTVINKGNRKLLIYRLENLNNLKNVIRDFTGCKDLKLTSDNVGSQKIYSSLYHKMKESVKLPQDYIDFYYKNNPRMDHFYTEDEKRAFLETYKR